jgi:hypothetical protein
MSKRRNAVRGLALGGLFLAAWPGHAADVKVQPAAGDGLVVTNATGTQERLRVQEAGPVYLPGLAPDPSADSILCTSTATGLVGTCAPPQPGHRIVCAEASASLSCNTPAPCTTDYVLNAVCPFGYMRLTLVRCTKPFSQNFGATVVIDPYLDSVLACHYQGKIDSFSTEDLHITILCIERLCPV